jgi:ATP-dependent Lhr-like helicase
MMNSNEAVLAQFHPLVAAWFEEQVGQPTDIQQQAWPRIAGGEHLLITAPTGSGKTLTAFLWALNQLITEQWSTGHTSVLYVSPLRALNYDIQRNLLGPLDELGEVFKNAGDDFPDIRVLTRSGDTPQSDRRQMLRHPPEILITTPESLNLLLSSNGGRSILTDLSTVILDEIHAVYSTKRGVYLMTAVDRLVRLSGEFQRIALSATIRPLEAVSEFVGGFEMVGDSGNPRYTPRPISIIHSNLKKRYDLRIRFPREPADPEEPDSPWDPLAEKLKKIIAKNHSTLIFVNSRRLCEMLTLLINQGEEEPLAYAHHGSLSREFRAEVERKLKGGALRAIVATNSLELGIDIGALDEVVLIQSPFSISSTIQRVGRSGHQVNQVSLGTLFPTRSNDLLESAVLVPAILNQDIESSKTALCPLDVLAQVIVSMVGVETWEIDTLFANLKASYPYRHLSREQFDLVLHMLAGRYAESRIRELKPLISIDRLDNTVRARRGSLQLLYLSGGVIPDRGYFHLRHQETNARIGELDEEFVWEASVGDTFTLGTQNWQIHRITHNDVFVLPASPQTTAAPFWKTEENDRDFHFSERIGQFLEAAESRLDDPDFAEALQQENFMEPVAVEKLIDFLKRQRESTACPLPHRHHLLIEIVSAGPGGTPQTVIHTLWGGRVNRPFALALSAAWQARFGYRLELRVSNDFIVLQLPHEISGEELLSLVPSPRIESLLRTRLEGSGFFGARFRECAGRALLLPRRKFNERMPLWLSRLRSQKLLDAVLNYKDFPILLETWRTCMQDEFDLESLKQVLTELEAGAISWTQVHTARPSPFTQSDWWRQVNQYIYMDDSPRTEKISKLRGSLLREIALTTGLRPAVSRRLVDRFEMKRKRMSPGYSPQTFPELLDWVADRVAIPEGEWEDLLKAIRADHGVDPETFMESPDKLVQFHPAEAREPFTAAREMLPRIIGSLYSPGGEVRVESLTHVPLSKENKMVETLEGEAEGSASLLSQWLQYYGPVTVEFIRRTFGIEKERLQLALEDLIDSQKIIQGPLVTDGESDEVCDSENFEFLLRLVRVESRPTFEPLGIESLPLFLADCQGITKLQDNIEGLRRCMEQLLCYPAEAGIWESEILPARLHPYDPSWLDTLMQEGGLFWVGGEGHRVTFCFESDLDLLQEEIPEENNSTFNEADSPADVILRQESDPLVILFPDSAGRYDFSSLRQRFEGSDAELVRWLWDEVWQGRITNDTFIALRRALTTRFRFPETEAGTTEKLHQRVTRLRRLSLTERKRGSLFPGNWHVVPRPELPDDLLETEERRKDRARLLLDRYGILFRELLQREYPALRWSNIFRALRIMELSGEVMAGIFFHGIPGPQFISHRAFGRLQRKLPEDVIYWVNATDPASLCGIQLDAIRGMLPPRMTTTHLVFRGTTLVLVSKRNGGDLTFHVPPEDPDLSQYLAPLRHLLMRKSQPVRRISIETINGESAPQSAYVPVLRTSFDVTVDYRNVTLYRKMR